MAVRAGSDPEAQPTDLVETFALALKSGNFGDSREQPQTLLGGNTPVPATVATLKTITRMPGKGSLWILSSQGVFGTHLLISAQLLPNLLLQ